MSLFYISSNLTFNISIILLICFYITSAPYKNPFFHSVVFVIYLYQKETNSSKMYPLIYHCFFLFFTKYRKKIHFSFIYQLKLSILIKFASSLKCVKIKIKFFFLQKKIFNKKKNLNESRSSQKLNPP